MAEKIISPGVFTNEIDQSFLPAAVGNIGAALIGPTLKGPAGIPTVVTSYSDFQAKFGDVVKSGSNSFQFLTSHTAEEYLKHAESLTVVRIMDGDIGFATADVPSSTANGGTGNSFTLKTLSEGTIMNNSGSTGNVTTNKALTLGSIHNIRYEIQNVNNAKGTFTLLIRAGNDTEKRKNTLESFVNVSLDPEEPNYIGKAVGDERLTLRTDGTTRNLESSG